MRDFIEECTEWLEQFGYFVHNYSGNYKSCTFINTEQEHSPAIRCWITDSGEKRMQIMDSGKYKMFLTLQTGEMQFKHPDLERYLKVFRHYSMLAEQFPPL